MKLKHTLFGLACLIFHSASFAQRNRYEVVLIDSILVESLEQIQITDFSPTKDRFLAYGTMTKKCMEVDRDGNIISEVDLTGEGPGHFGEGITQLGYFGDDIIINGPNVYFTYDENWNYKGRIVYTSGGAWLPLGMISGAPEVFIKGSIPQIVKPFDHTYFGSKKVSNNYFSTAKLIEIISKSNDEASYKIEYPKSSIYQSQTTFYNSHKAIISYNKSKNRLYLALPLEPVVYEYDVETFNRIESIPLNLVRFKEPQGIPFEDQHKNGRRGFGPTNQLNAVYAYTNSTIHKISSEGEVTIIEYQTGTEGNTGIKDIQEASQRAKKESETFTVFYKGMDKVAEVKKAYTRFVRIDEYHFLSHEINTEEELDYSKFYIYELKKVN
ncbi:MAG: hypothetical protein HWE21_03215 [Cytophagia bacterium]|nr:hypothetical protein [Cytophagia bacterium]